MKIQKGIPKTSVGGPLAAAARSVASGGRGCGKPRLVCMVDPSNLRNNLDLSLMRAS